MAHVLLKMSYRLRSSFVDTFIFLKTDENWDKKAECWICYDSETTEFGPMIEPCACKGDVGAVHHDCLKRWLIEVSSILLCNSLASSRKIPDILMSVV